MFSQHQPLIKDPQTSPSRETLINSYQKSMKPSRKTLKKFGKPSKSLIIQKSPQSKLGIKGHEESAPPKPRFFYWRGYSQIYIIKNYRFTKSISPTLLGIYSITNLQQITKRKILVIG